MLNPWLGMGLVLAILAGLMGGLRLYQRFSSPHPELVRKLLHMGMGLVTLSFPWLFDAAWPVLVLASLSVAGLLALRVFSSLRSGLGKVVGGVGRTSLGELYFPVAVTILFVLFVYSKEPNEGRRLCLYGVPILLLTLADAAAALIGVSYGRWRYATPDGEKSAEGSVAFFMCAFFCVHVPLLIGTDIGRSETLLIALLLAWLAMMFEAIAWGGLDNLVLPLVSYLLLQIYVTLPEEELGTRFIITAVLMGFLLVYRRRSTLVGSAVLAAFIVGYVSWALGGWHWLLAPLVLFLTYTRLSPRTEVNSRRIHNVHAVVSVAAPSFIWLFLAKIFDLPAFLVPYTLAFSVQLALIAIARLRPEYPRLSVPALLTICVAKGWLFVFVPYVLAEGITVDALLGALFALPAVALAAVAFYYVQPRIEDCPTDLPRWWRQATIAAIGSLFGLVPVYWS